MSQEIFAKRLNDLANMAYRRGIPTYTDYLDLNQQTEYIEYITSNKMPPVNTILNGGLLLVEGEDFLERKMACFYPKETDEYLSEAYVEFPICIIEIRPANKKFADNLTHRDFLGAIMNLGIERHLIGDILVKDNMAYVFAVKKMAEFVCDNLIKIKHTTVHASICEQCDFSYVPAFKEEKGSVASERIDAIISFAFNMSRNEASAYISAGKVFVNAKETVSKSHTLKYGDIVSVRGMGRFVFDEVVSTTKKGRFYIKIRKYI